MSDFCHGKLHPERTARMIEMSRSGLTLQQIGEQFGVSRERVRQIVAYRGVAAGERGRNVRKVNRNDMAVARQKAKRDDRASKLYGCDYATLVRINGGHRTKQKGCLAFAYVNQLRAAAWRGIEFRLTFPAWVSLWEKSGHLADRGRGHGKYVMSRFGDAGAYEIGNVFIQLADDNNREGRRRAVARGVCTSRKKAA